MLSNDLTTKRKSFSVRSSPQKGLDFISAGCSLSGPATESRLNRADYQVSMKAKKQGKKQVKKTLVL